MTDKILNEENLKNVTGGTASAPDEEKKKEFEAAWRSLQLDSKGLTGTEMEDLYAQWALDGYKPAAKTFLESCKTI